MEKLFNEPSMAVGILGGILSYCFGGWDILLKTVLILTVLDYITGIVKSVVNHNLSSYISFKGIAKKVMMYAVIAAAVVIGRLMNDSIPLREVIITFFIANEGISLLENAAEFVEVPEGLKDILLQLRDKGGKKQ